MLDLNRIGRTRAGRALVAVGAGAGLAVAMPAGAHALPATGSADAGSSSVGLPPLSGLDTGSADGALSQLGLDTGSLGSAPTQQCNESTQSGGAGVTETRHNIGRGGPTSFVLDYETLNVPDDIEVFYQGNRIADTGYVGDDRNEGTGSIVVNVPAGAATFVLVRVTGPDTTQWSYTVHCPA